MKQCVSRASIYVKYLTSRPGRPYVPKAPLDPLALSGAEALWALALRFRRVGPAQPIEIVCVWPLAELIFAGKAAYFDVDRALAYRAFLGWAIRHAKMSNSEPRRRRYAHGE
jgi:hypothetical protein